MSWNYFRFIMIYCTVMVVVSSAAGSEKKKQLSIDIEVRPVKSLGRSGDLGFVSEETSLKEE